MATIEKIAELIVKVSNGRVTKEQIKPEAHLSNDLKLDSLAMSELLVLAEDEFNVRFSTDEVTKIKTVAEMLTLANQVVSAK